MKRPRMRNTIIDREEIRVTRAETAAPAREEKQNRPRDVAAFDAMCAARPLVPPPFDFGPLTRPRAGLIAAREDRKRGVLV